MRAAVWLFTHPHMRAVVCSLCALLEGTFGWITGSAWTTAVATAILPWQNMYPNPYVTAMDFMGALLLTALAVLWIVYMGEDPTSYDGLHAAGLKSADQPQAPCAHAPLRT